MWTGEVRTSMRIALFTETFLPNINGVVTTLCYMIEYLQACGHEVIVFAPQDSPTSYFGAEVVPLRGVPLPFYPALRLTPPQFGIVSRLREFKPDLIHLGGTIALGPIGRIVASQLQVPLVSAYHTDFPAYSVHYGMGFLRSPTYRYLRWIHNACALTLCPSSETLHDLHTRGFQRLRLWGRGVDTVQFHPRFRSHEWRQSIGLQPHETLLLYTGRLATEKRLELLVKAVRGLENVRLVLVGDGPARTLLERQMVGMPVHFAGFLSGDALATAYASADLFVFPSDTETFGQVIQEAMASGLPVVAAGTGGARDVVADGQTGILFTPGDVATLRTQIARLLADPSRRADFGIAGRAIVERRTWSSVMDELLRYYQYALRWTRLCVQMKFMRFKTETYQN